MWSVVWEGSVNGTSCTGRISGKQSFGIPLAMSLYTTVPHWPPHHENFCHCKTKIMIIWLFLKMKRRKEEEEEEKEESLMIKHTKSCEHWKLFFRKLHCPKLKGINWSQWLLKFIPTVHKINLYLATQKNPDLLCQTERHAFAFPPSMKASKATRGVLSGTWKSGSYVLSTRRQRTFGKLLNKC